MSLVLVATPGASDANSYLTVAEAQDYYDSRGFTDAWDDADSQAAALVWATRTMDAILSGYKEYVPPSSGDTARGAYFRTYPAWTGLPASTTQALAWPRTGMFDRNGNAIDSSVVPQALKDAVAELAGQMAKQDRTLDNDVAVQGITSVRAGSVAVAFRNSNISVLKVLPDIVRVLLVPSWMTDDVVTPAMQAEFDVIGDWCR